MNWMTGYFRWILAHWFGTVIAAVLLVEAGAIVYQIGVREGVRLERKRIFDKLDGLKMKSWDEL